jgi:hypothetical protein
MFRKEVRMKANLLKRGKPAQHTTITVAVVEPEDLEDLEVTEEDEAEDEDEDEAEEKSPAENLKRPATPSYDVRSLLEPNANTISETLAYSISDAVDRLEKTVTIQGAMLLKVAERATQAPPPAVVTVETTPGQSTPGAFRVRVIRDRTGSISELVVTPTEG